MRFRPPPVCLVLLLLAGACGSGPTPPSIPTENAIWNGTPTAEFPAVGALTAEGGAFCTGALIAPDVVLTAAHCVDYLVETEGEDQRFFTGPGAPGYLDGGITVDGAVGHPDYDGWSADIGLVFLAEEALEAPVFVHVDEMVEDEWVGEWVTLVGYGITGDGESDSGEKLMTEVEVYAFDEDVFFHYTAGTNACFGDSGGPSLAEFEEGWRILGVLSAVFPHLHDDTVCIGGGGYQIRVDLYLDWIEEYALVNVEPGDDDTTGDDDTGDDDTGGGPPDEDDDLDDDDACQCRQAPRRAPAGALAIAALAALLASRRRRL